jgi:hypothetical protein
MDRAPTAITRITGGGNAGAVGGDPPEAIRGDDHDRRKNNGRFLFEFAASTLRRGSTARWGSSRTPRPLS